MKKVIIFFLSFFVLHVKAESSFSLETKDLTSKFEKLLGLKEAHFKNLRFTLSDKKIKRSVTYKLFLKDQFGREWMFKDTSADGSLAVYKLSLLLGMASPEIHNFELAVNDQPIKGSLQLFLPSTRGFNGDYNELSEAQLNYFLYSHLLSWLSLNHHVHADQFILDNNQIYRIDNSVSFTLLGIDSLDVSYVSPLLNHVRFPGYVEFWNYVFKNGHSFDLIKKKFAHFKDIQTRKLNLDFKGALLRSLLVQSLSDEFYINFYRPCIEGEFKNCGNNSFGSHLALFPYGYLKFDPKRFAPLMLERKNHVHDELKKFYQGLIQVYGRPMNLEIKKNDFLIFVKNNTQRLEAEILDLEKSPVEKSSSTNALNIKTEEDYRSFKDLQNLTVLNSITDQKSALKLMASVRALLLSPRAKSFSSNLVALENIKYLEGQIIKLGYDRQKVWSVVSSPAKFYEIDYVKNLWPPKW